MAVDCERSSVRRMECTSVGFCLASSMPARSAFKHQGAFYWWFMHPVMAERVPAYGHGNIDLESNQVEYSLLRAQNMCTRFLSTNPILFIAFFNYFCAGLSSVNEMLIISLFQLAC